MKTLDIIKNKRSDIMAIASKYGIKNIRIFGSAIRGDDSDTSDIDLLVSIEDGRGLYDFVSFKLDAEEILNRKVDVVSERSLNHLISPHILNDARDL